MTWEECCSGMKGVQLFFSAAVFTESADARITIPTLSEMEEAAGDDQARGYSHIKSCRRSAYPGLC